jgi:hypothetical protein
LALSACGPANPSQALTPQVITVYSTAAAQPWLTRLFNCASGQSAVLSVVNEPQSAMVLLRLGEPASLSTPSFQVGTEAVLVVVNQQHASSSLSVEQVRGLFSGQINDWSQIDSSKTGRVQVWVFAQDEDVQQVFANTLMDDPISSSARLATSPEEMSQAIANDDNAIGILSQQRMTGNITQVYTEASVPVLAITPSEPQGVLGELLGCMQR